MARISALPRASVQPDQRSVSAPVYIRYRNTQKLYRGRTTEVQALEPFSMDVHESEFVSLLGPSGCGKSTLLMMTAGLLPASGGDIVINGVPVRGPFTDLGIVFQRDILLDWRTVTGNIILQAEFRGLDLAAARKRAGELLEMAGLGDLGERYPWELSGGQRQRVSLCRALLHDPPLLLMDEPFGALDALTRDQLNLDLQRIWAQTRKTILFVTHSITEAVFLSDRILVMSPRPGRVVEEIQVDLPRPRKLSIRETPEFGRYAGRIRDIFRNLGILKE